ncbi:MAG: YgiT-type zinc finger protein [Dehalococcoidia bacterium]
MRVGKCPICGGETREDIVEVQVMISEEPYIIQGIKAEVCVQCGERLYSLDEVRRIEELRKGITERRIKPTGTREIKVVSV